MKVIQIWCGPITEEYRKYEECMDQTKKLFEDNGYEYLRVLQEDVKYNDPIIDSDTLRFEIACNEPDMLYIDCDLVFNQIPVFNEDGLPYFGQKKNVNNNCVFYVNNCSDFFKSVFTEREKRELKFVFGWPNRVIRSRKTYLIDEDLYIHHQYTTGIDGDEYEDNTDISWYQSY